MPAQVRTFFLRHPALRDAVRWVLPAVLVGATLRLLLLHYSPYAYWGSDSKSYYEFAYRLWVNGLFELDEKRRVLYPLLMAAVTLLPGAPLQWLAWLQHGFGLLTLVPLAYVVRKMFVFWRWWIVPVTVAYAGLPVILWYEHELLGETLFFALLLWSFAGWVAWAREPRLERAARLWWLFFAPFALFILTKPSGRFYWPGLLLGLVLVAAWRRLRRAHLVALGALMIVTLLLGSKAQGIWLLYVATFPLTQLETPRHAPYKAQIRDLVEPLRQNLDHYYRQDEEPFEMLRNPGRYPERPAWAALAADPKLETRIYKELALEAIAAEPLHFLYLGLQRVIVSANLSTFRSDRFAADHMPRRFAPHYEEAFARMNAGKWTPIPLVLGFPPRGPLPPFEEMAPRFSPAPDSLAARAVPAWVEGYETIADLVDVPRKGTLAQSRPTALGCWLLAAMLLSLARPYRSTAGVWMLAALGYVLGVFLMSQVNPRYFGAVWPVVVPLLALPADLLATALRGWWRRRATPRRTAPPLA